MSIIFKRVVTVILVPVSILQYQTTSRRDATVGVYATDIPGTLLGNITVGQLASDSDPTKTMIFEVRANLANDFTACLPICGCDCFVDWGDGTVEHINTNNPLHKYDVTEGTSFEVKIAGSVSSLSFQNTESRYLGCITSVKQWGNTGLRWMNYAFRDCYALTQVPNDETKAFADVTDMQCAFSGTGLATVPSGLFTYAGNVVNAEKMFYNCHSLRSVPEGLFDGMVKVQKIANLFNGCKQLESSGLPESLFWKNTEVTDASSLFDGCSALTSIPAKLFANNPVVVSFNEAFRSCQSLKTIPVSLFDNNRKVTNFNGTFFCCYDISGESPYTVIGGVKVHLYERASYPDYFVRPSSYDGCFNACSKLTDWSAIQAAGWGR